MKEQSNRQAQGRIELENYPTKGNMRKKF